MFGAGFIQQMITTMRDNRALLSSQHRKKNNSEDRRAGKTKLKFPKGDPERIKMTREKYNQRSKAQWLLIYIFFGLFFGAMLTWIFT